MLKISIPSREDPERISERIVELSSQVLSRKDNPNYIALKVGDGAYSNAITVRWRKDTVSFHIPSSDLVQQAFKVGFCPYNRGSARPFFKNKYYFEGLKLSHFQEHEALFKAIVKDSADYVQSQKPKGK